jgi:hypothetical protein
MDTLCKICSLPEREHTGQEVHRYQASHIPVSPKATPTQRTTAARDLLAQELFQAVSVDTSRRVTAVDSRTFRVRFSTPGLAPVYVRVTVTGEA